MAGMLRTALGPAIAEWLDDPAVIEVMLNLDGRIWIDRLTDGLADTGECLAPADGERIIRLVAHHVGAKAHPSNRRISAELPETGERFGSLLPPIVAAPTFAIRKPAVAIFTLEDDVPSGIMLQHALGAAAAAGAAIGRRPGRENHCGDYHHHYRSDARLRRFELFPDVLFLRRRGARLMGGISPSEPVAGFDAAVDRALTEPILLGGAPRAVAIANGTLAAAVGLGLRLWIPDLAIWAIGHVAAVWAAKRDAQFVEVVQRHLRYPAQFGV